MFPIITAIFAGTAAGVMLWIAIKEQSKYLLVAAILMALAAIAETFGHVYISLFLILAAIAVLRIIVSRRSLLY